MGRIIYTLIQNDGFGKRGEEVELVSETYGLATVIRTSDGRKLSVFKSSLGEREEDLFTTKEPL